VRAERVRRGGERKLTPPDKQSQARFCEPQHTVMVDGLKEFCSKKLQVVKVKKAVLKTESRTGR